MQNALGTFAYTYDANGNITSVSKNGTVVEQYTYDHLNQLTTATLGSDVYQYRYDVTGNILDICLNGEYVHSMDYTDSQWADKLTYYDDRTITYDAIGNPIHYRDGMRFTWQNGRQLYSLTTSDQYVMYLYNADGYRSEKHIDDPDTGIINGHFYDYNGSDLICERWAGNTLWFLRDESGSPVGFTHNDTAYYYVKNLQGDITGIVNANGALVAQYSYDAWGNPLSITDASGNDVSNNASHIANINPLRYRGYYYDVETGLYYVSSRYYDPEIGRFISPDTTEILTATPMGLTDKNLYAYCDNNPVIRADHGGDFWNVVIGAAVGAVVGVAGQFISDLATSALNGKWTFSNWQTYAGAAVGGAVGGAILGGTGHVGLANAASGFVTTGVGMSLEKVTGASDKSWAEIGVNAVADGAISYGLGKLPGVKNVTKGRNNMSAVYRSGLTKLRNKTVSHMSKKVIGKGLVSGFVGGLAMDGYYGVKQYGYNRVRNRILRYAR